MKINCDTTEFQMEQKSAVAIGKFDGVHRGHMELLSHIIQMKKKKMKKKNQSIKEEYIEVFMH